MGLPSTGPAGGGGVSRPRNGDRPHPAWICGASDSSLVADLARRVRAFGMDVAAGPESARHAIVLLSPPLARADPPSLVAWVRSRGTGGIVLALADGQATWNEEERRFADDADAVPPSLRDAFSTPPLVLDLREVDDLKLDRVARRLVAATSSGEPTGPPVAMPPPGAAVAAPERSRGRRLLIAAILVAAVLVAALGLTASLMTRGDRVENQVTTIVVSATVVVTTVFPTSVPATLGGPTTTHRPITTTLATVPTTVLTTAPATTTVPAAAASERDVLPWILVGVLAVALAASVALHLRRRKPPSGPLPPTPSKPSAAPVVGAVQVFISHDTKSDGVVAHTLAERLRQRHLAVWIAPDSIGPGDPWVFAIERGLTGSRVALVLVSPAALSSAWVLREIEMIINLELDGRLHVVPVRVAPCELPLLLSAYQWVDISNFDGAAEALRERFGQPASSSSSRS